MLQHVSNAAGDGHVLDGGVEGRVAERRLVVVDVVDIQLEAKVAQIEVLVRLETVNERGVLEGLDLLIEHLGRELRRSAPAARHRTRTFWIV